MGKVFTSNVPTSNNTTKNQSSEIYRKRENNDSTWKYRIEQAALQFAHTFVGQAIMMQFGKWLWTLEKTATWISNGKTDGKRGKAPAGLVRPLPWVLFLPTLIALRFIRVMLSLVSICIGFDEIEASTMIAFLHESRRKIRNALLEANRIKYRKSSMDHAKETISSILSKLSRMLFQTSDATKVSHNNKSSLNTLSEVEDQNATDCDESDVEEKLYQNFIQRSIETSDSDDDDFIYNLNGEDISDTDSQSSIATEDLSDADNETEKQWSGEVTPSTAKSTNGNETENHSNHSADASVIVDQCKEEDKPTHDTQPSAENDINITANRVIEDATKAVEANSVPHSRAKNINRQNKNGGRNHAKNQNNGNNPINGDHAENQTKIKTPKHNQVLSTTNFIAEAAASDRT